MHTHPYAGGGNIVIDNCPRCALNWLDVGELEQVARAPERQRRKSNWAEWIVPVEGDVPELD
jgi:Zn-finger nucleic acid-binding protein